MHKFKKGDVVMVVDDQYEGEHMGPLSPLGVRNGDVGLVLGVHGQRPRVVFDACMFAPEIGWACAPQELHYIGRL